MMTLADRLLDIYFRRFLEIVAYLPPFLAYRIIQWTGGLFRDFERYASSYEPGVLQRAVKNIENTNLSISNPKRLIKDYLPFETRFTLENIWIRKQKTRYILRCFDPRSVKVLQQLLRRQFVIVTAHNSGICMLVQLIGILKHKNSFVCMNVLNCPWEIATPMQRAFQKMWGVWRKTQGMIYVEESNVLERSRRALREGRSVIMAADVPCSRGGTRIDLFGQRVSLPVGASNLAAETGLPMLIAIPWALRCSMPYRIHMRVIKPTRNFTEDTMLIARHIEDTVKRSLACWNGWLYLDMMMEKNGDR